MKIVFNASRRAGKALIGRQAVELALDLGVRVARVSPGKVEYLRRYGHLTSIETKPL